MTKKKNNNLNSFIFFTSTTIIITSFSVALLTVKNECLKTQHEINQLHKQYASNIDIVKELQSNKNYLMSEKNISEMLGNKMVSIVPETLSIKIDR